MLPLFLALAPPPVLSLLAPSSSSCTPHPVARRNSRLWPFASSRLPTAGYAESPHGGHGTSPDHLPGGRTRVGALISSRRHLPDCLCLRAQAYVETTEHQSTMHCDGNDSGTKSTYLEVVPKFKDNEDLKDWHAFQVTLVVDIGLLFDLAPCGSDTVGAVSVLIFTRTSDFLLELKSYVREDDGALILKLAGGLCVMIFCLEWVVLLLAFVLRYHAFVDGNDSGTRNATIRSSAKVQDNEDLKDWPWPFQV
nr:Transmembrane protein [Ipomoea batatas]